MYVTTIHQRYRIQMNRRLTRDNIRLQYRAVKNAHEFETNVWDFPVL